MTANRSGYSVGQRVRYSPVIGQEPDDRVWEITAARDLGCATGSRWVYWLKGKPGCVAEEALTAVEEAQAYGLGPTGRDDE